MTVAVMHSLDVGFNGGKANILGSWIKEMSGDLIDSSKKPVKEAITERTQAFFDSLPKVSKSKRK